MPALLDDALSWLSGQRQAMVALLGELVERNSFTGNREGVAAVAALLEPRLRGLGLSPETVPSARFGPHLAFAGPAPGPRVFLVGHLDTVFPPGTFAGFRVEGDRGRGPGAFDMKGGLAVMLFALEALHRSGLLAGIPVAGMLVSDEESGSPESQPLLRDRARGATCALALESGREGDRLVTRRKGGATVRAVAHGVAAHAGNEHEKGRNAIWALARFVDRAQALTDRARGVTVNVGIFRGGTAKNTVPAEAVCEVDLRFAAPEDGARLEATLSRVAGEAAVEGTRIDLERVGWRDPLVRTEASAALAREYLACAAASGLGTGEAPLAGGGSDACTTGAMGIPSIDALGPRGRGFHTHEEEVDLSSLVPKAAALARFLAGRAGPS
ncbi:MAG TPA: M20 family metallopeptidase [Anaeromyxobacteraceae bacterium]|nr:M20 family metallopeptidase [Anaeromyxobacteraceae bacterium]